MIRQNKVQRAREKVLSMEIIMFRIIRIRAQSMRYLVTNTRRLNEKHHGRWK
jgi:hypothetical protein